MQIVKSLNHNAALALDGSGKQIVVMGKGVGFPKTPYELRDLSLVERTFYDVNPKYHGLAAELPEQILSVSAEIVEQAAIELDCTLDPNLTFTLADHLNFACERTKSGVELTTPLAYDVRHLYAREYTLGLRAIELFEHRVGVVFPGDEAVFVALHLINAEFEYRDLHTLTQAMTIIDDVGGIVEQKLGIVLDKDSYNYSRFAMHIQYLVQRLVSGKQVERPDSGMLRSLAREYPEVYVCTLQVADYFKKNWDFVCNEEETLYLMLHIHRVQSRK